MLEQWKQGTQTPTETVPAIASPPLLPVLPQAEPPPAPPPSDFSASVLECPIGDVLDYTFDGEVTESSSDAGSR